MGLQSSSQGICPNLAKSPNNLPQDLVFYLTVEDRQFGTVPVYSSTKRPSSYVAKLQKPVENSKIFNAFEQIQNNQLSCLASLHAFEITRQKYCTGHLNQKITAYWQYYNYTFEDFLKMRFLKRIPFTENELWLIIKSCCQAYSLFSYYDLVLDLDLKHIMVVPEGRLKIYWHYVELKNTHLKYYKKIRQNIKERRSMTDSLQNRNFRVRSGDEFESFYFSPQQIEGIERKQETLKIDFERANSFRLGMIIMYCITLTNPIKTCYGVSNMTGQRRLKPMVMNSIYQSKIQGSQRYSQRLKNLIGMLLLQQKQKRIQISRIQQICEGQMEIEGELQMGMGGNENPIYMPSSSRKQLGDDERKGKMVRTKGWGGLGLNSVSGEEEKGQYNKGQGWGMNSQKVIEESEVRRGGGGGGKVGGNGNGHNNNNNKPDYNNNQNNNNDKIPCQQNDNNDEKVDGQKMMNVQRGYEIDGQGYDIFDTKTIKISSSYHNHNHNHYNNSNSNNNNNTNNRR